MKKNEAKFQGGYNEMCDSLSLGYENYEASQTDFQKINSKYTKDYGQMAVKAIIEARKLPGIAPRISVQTNLKEKLQSQANISIINWLVIVSLVEKVWKKEEWSSIKNSAGQASYEVAANGDWSALKTMLQDGSDFITANQEVLVDAGMQPGFPATYSKMQDAYNNLFDAYTGSKQKVNAGTNAKVEALNKVYDDFIGLSRDARRIYRGNPGKIKLFTYTALLRKIAGTGKTGFHIRLRSEGSLLPVTSSTIFLTPGNYSFAADDKGIITAGIKAGAYTFVITTPGSEIIEGKLKATTGVMHREDFIIKPAKVSIA